jgi:hypothetical protein
MFGEELTEIEGGDMGDCKNKHQCYTSEEAHKSMKPVTYLECTIHTLANAPSLNMFDEELKEIEGGDMGGLQKQTSVLHVRRSLQIDETCYTP